MQVFYQTFTKKISGQHQVMVSHGCPVLLPSLEAVAQRCSVKEVFFEISQNSQETFCARDSFLTKF